MNTPTELILVYDGQSGDACRCESEQEARVIASAWRRRSYDVNVREFSQSAELEDYISRKNLRMH